MTRPRQRVARAIKRLLDIAVALGLLVLLAPLLLLLALVVRVALGSPVLYCQVRPGLHGRPFTLRKFRSMSDQRDASGALLPDAARLGRLGTILRRSSLDELPQLWNVLVGEMSLVGPRPLLMSYLELYTPEQRRRHQVRPGMTGWVQVRGRNALDWEAKFALDCRYVDQWSLWLDLRIVLLTIWVVLRRRGVEQPGFATSAGYRPVVPPHD